MAEGFEVVGKFGRVRGQRFGSPAGPLVVGLHGLSGNMRTFDVLGERLGGEVLQLVALDLRGRGRSDTTPPGPYGWKNHALDVFTTHPDAADAVRRFLPTCTGDEP